MNSGAKRERAQQTPLKTTADRERILGELANKVSTWTQLEVLVERDEDCIGASPEVDSGSR